MWNDPTLGIDWQATAPIISGKDGNYAPFTEFVSPF